MGAHCAGVSPALPGYPLQLIVRYQLRPRPEDPTQCGDTDPFGATSPTLLLDHLGEGCSNTGVSMLVSRLPAQGLHAHLQHLNWVHATSSQSSTEHAHSEALVGLRRPLSSCHLVDGTQHWHEQADANTVKEKLPRNAQLQATLQSPNSTGLPIPLHTINPTIVGPRLTALRQLVV
eukprot:CAMPEP_0204294020 /NCGR_PEP_ID=MMETSP0468-20130131/67245_1 /ASSEMBLY_ACC=CAM_ASM_000383 /TAXON_ID=2969 /ORGANISM="Oxyrrhis marina" /LENGTH=175 /DNA_ID=CAMNT_0051272527 /DNA_START=319 /DNA_END=846 /DNA_ORIENTATION=-